MSDFFNAFWREFQYKIVDLIVCLANQHPLVAWIILYFFGLPILYFCFVNSYHKYIDNITNIFQHDDKTHPPSYERADFYCVEIMRQPSFWWRESVVVTMN